VDWKLEVVVIPVGDVDRAREFYADRLGFRVDTDHSGGEQFRVVQVTPPGSLCSIVFGTGIGAGMPGSAKGSLFVVDDIDVAHERLHECGIENTGVVHFENGVMIPGHHPEHEDYGSFVFFSDPDGNTWGLQQGRRPSAQ
jgi:catechol 2,3-dioxygenase-like lactoylglutathione lyase family enzyme